MYRCYFTTRGNIVAGQDLEATTTMDGAVVACYQLLSVHPETGALDGIEVWQGAEMVYQSR